MVGWQPSSCDCRSDLALDALEMGLWTREHAGHDVAVRYTQRLARAGAFDSLYKAELVRNRGPWTGIDDLEIATAEYIDWFNHRRLHW